MENSKIDLVWDSPLRKEWKLNFWPLFITLGKVLGTTRLSGLKTPTLPLRRSFFTRFQARHVFPFWDMNPGRSFWHTEIVKGQKWTYWSYFWAVRWRHQKWRDQKWNILTWSDAWGGYLLQWLFISKKWNVQDLHRHELINFNIFCMNTILIYLRKELFEASQENGSTSIQELQSVTFKSHDQYNNPTNLQRWC